MLTWRTSVDWRIVAVALVAGATSFAAALPLAEACGCLSPPVPEFDDEQFAVNQQSEQIVFEVEPDGRHVTAHVLIRYAGAPDQFAWIVPTPTVPDLDLSESVMFGLLDAASSPIVGVAQPSLCPDPEYRCKYHDFPTCNFGREQNNGGTNNGGNNSAGFDGAADAGAPNGGAPPVEVIRREQIGSYDTVIFAADEADLAVQWLQDNGFIVNDTMAPYMQPYLDANMVFVASKLIAGAGIEEIKPLKMRYEATNPMIPLQLTAVAAEPHLTVTTYIVSSNGYFEPIDHPVIGFDEREISSDATGRPNYPARLSRLIDEAGGDGFAIEYTGPIPEPSFDSCCGGGSDDWCFIGFDGICQCPLDEFDADDCGDQEDLRNAATALQDLRTTYSHMTRLTTRLSAHEMTFDPMFGLMSEAPPVAGRLVLNGQRRQMFACESDIIDDGLYRSIEEIIGCATTYCGDGTCAVTSDGRAGCVCNPGSRARQFTDLDGVQSVTCVPEVNTVDLAAGGLELPGACKGRTCGDQGICLDVGGFATCLCDVGFVSVPEADLPVPSCQPITRTADDPGGRDYTRAMEDVRACAPRPPECGDWGWLVPNENKRIDGVICPSSLPEQSEFEVPREPTCDDYPFYEGPTPGDPSVDPNYDGNPSTPLDDKEVQGGCGSSEGCATSGASPIGLIGLLGFAMLGLRRRRR